MQGAAWLAMKTEGDQQAFVKAWLNRAWMAFVALYLAATVATFFVNPSLFAGVLGNPIFWVLLVLLLGSLVYVPVGVKAGKTLGTFLATSAVVASVVGFCGLSLYPRLVPSSLNPEWSLTIYNAASTPKTQTVMLIIALIGMPLVIAYTAFIYHAFKGKVELGKDSY
jgi:cytochrome bd ubiquinol oxidase subunit II